MTTREPVERENSGRERVRSAAMLRHGPGYIAGSAVTLCLCGGMLSETDAGIVWCLECERDPE